MDERLYERSRRDTVWKGFRLFAVGIRRPIAEIIPDGIYASMWRFRLLPGGKLSDMVNLSRAKDAAVTVALAALNAPIRRSGGPRIEQTPSLAPEAPADEREPVGASGEISRTIAAVSSALSHISDTVAALRILSASGPGRSSESRTALPPWKHRQVDNLGTGAAANSSLQLFDRAQ